MVHIGCQVGKVYRPVLQDSEGVYAVLAVLLAFATQARRKSTRSGGFAIRSLTQCSSGKALCGETGFLLEFENAGEKAFGVCDVLDRKQSSLQINGQLARLVHVCLPQCLWYSALSLRFFGLFVMFACVHRGVGLA